MPMRTARGGALALDLLRATQNQLQSLSILVGVIFPAQSEEVGKNRAGEKSVWIAADGEWRATAPLAARPR